MRVLFDGPHSEVKFFWNLGFVFFAWRGVDNF
jgi:hypothetical protein